MEWQELPKHNEIQVSQLIYFRNRRDVPVGVREDERIREDIPVPDSLGKDAFLVGIFTNKIINK